MKGSITIQNHTDSIIKVQASENNSPTIEEFKVNPNDYFVFFTDRFASLRWDKQNEDTGK